MENINNPFFDKLVTSQEKETISDLHNYLIENIHNMGGKFIKDFEIGKSKRDLELIHFVSNYARKILTGYGRNKQIEIPLDNIHILKEGGTEQYTEGQLAEGAHSTIYRSILLDRSKSDFRFSIILFHELMHLMSYTALQITEEKADPKILEYRSGISVASRDGKYVYLENFEEAIISFLTSKFIETIKNENQELIEIPQSEKIDLGRNKELEMFKRITNEIFLRNQDILKSKEELLDIFIDAQINGNLNKIVRIIEKTFGKGSIKKIDYKKIH